MENIFLSLQASADFLFSVIKAAQQQTEMRAASACSVFCLIGLQQIKHTARIVFIALNRIGVAQMPHQVLRVFLCAAGQFSLSPSEH